MTIQEMYDECGVTWVEDKKYPGEQNKRLFGNGGGWTKFLELSKTVNTDSWPEVDKKKILWLVRWLKTK